MPRLSRPDDAQTVWSGTREMWVFNPGPRLDLCLAEGVYDFVFHQKTYQFKKNMAISPSKHLTMLGQNYPWRAALVDYHEALALLYTAERGWDAPAAAWPMWSATRDTNSLIRLLERYPEPGEPVGLFTGAIEPARAAEGQEQRILICNFPKHNGQWEGVFRDLMFIKLDFPHIRFHLHGQKSIPRTLGTGVDSFDHPVTIDWIGNQPRLLLANGSILSYENYQQSDDHRRWARLIGIEAGSIFSQDDRTKKSRRMYLFNLRSLKWTFTNYDKVWSMRVVDESDLDTNDPDSSWVPIDLRYRPQSKVATDKWICDLCSINTRCPFSRPGAVCIVDDSEASNLAAKFKTRNSRDIVDALGTILGAQTSRAHQAMAAEQQRNLANPEDPKFSPEVTKMLATLFDQGVTLGRLVDPNLGGGSGKGQKVINASLARDDLGGSNPAQLAAAFAKELEAHGVDPETVTPEQAQTVLARLVPSGTLPPHVDDDEPGTAGTSSALAAGGNPVAPGKSSFRATPSLNP